MKMIWYAGHVYDIDTQKIKVTEQDVDRLISVYREFDTPKGRALLSTFKSYCNVGDPLAHADPARSHAQKWREIPYLRLVNDIELGKHLSGESPRNIQIIKEDEDEHGTDPYSSTGAAPDFTPQR